MGLVFGEAAGVGEDEGFRGSAPRAGRAGRQAVPVDVLQRVQGRISGCDDDGGEGELGKSCSWKASVPSESVAARFSRLLRSTPASTLPSRADTASRRRERSWKNHEFNDAEREVAKQWREGLATLDPEEMIGIVRNILPSRRSRILKRSRRRSTTSARATRAKSRARATRAGSPRMGTDGGARTLGGRALRPGLVDGSLCNRVRRLKSSRYVLPSTRELKSSR